MKGTAMTPNKVLANLAHEAIPTELWQKLPYSVSGSDWGIEIYDCAQWLAENDDINEDNLDELSYRYGESCVEDYYYNIANTFNKLALWGHPELDDEVEQAGLVTNSSTAKDVMHYYLYCAMRGLAYQVLTYAMETAKEEVSA